MGSLGISEILLIALVALVVLGPDKLPEASRSLGRMVREFRQALNNTDAQLKNEVDALKKESGLDELTDLKKLTREELEKLVQKQNR